MLATMEPTVGEGSTEAAPQGQGKPAMRVLAGAGGAVSVGLLTAAIFPEIMAVVGVGLLGGLVSSYIAAKSQALGKDRVDASPATASTPAP
jgi:hypothetical protein